MTRSSKGMQKMQIIQVSILERMDQLIITCSNHGDVTFNITHLDKSAPLTGEYQLLKHVCDNNVCNTARKARSTFAIPKIYVDYQEMHKRVEVQTLGNKRCELCHGQQKSGEWCA